MVTNTSKVNSNSDTSCLSKYYWN